MLEADYKIRDKKIIAKNNFGEEFVPDNNFGTTILLELQKR